MPLYQTKTIANILEPVAQQVNCQHTPDCHPYILAFIIAMFPVLSQYPPSVLPMTLLTGAVVCR